MSAQAEASAAEAPAKETAGKKKAGGGKGPLGRWLAKLRDDPNPILVKELRTIFRTKLFIRFLYLSTGLVGLIVLSGGAAVASESLAPAQVGQIVFQIFFSIALSIICLVAPAHAATSLTGEKETGTYESLILTGMDPARIVLGKFLASYAVFTLVIVAFSPIVGIAFLFGGISPWHVLLGFYGLLLVLGPAVAFGVAVSARLRSTRVSILLALIVFVPMSFFSTLILTALGEAAERSWGLSMSGPFWFTEALASRIGELDTLLLLGVLPLYVFGMMVWFLLASAIAGVRPAAEDRSTPFKLWSLVAVAGQVIILFGLQTLWDTSDQAEGGVAMNIFAAFPILFLALLFVNEPPLPPRLWELRMEEKGKLRRAFSIFGPGAAPTTRFGALMVLVATFGSAGASALGYHLFHPGHRNLMDADVGLLTTALGTASVCLFALTFGAWLRVVLRSGIASRVLTLAVLLAMVIVPLLMAVILDPDSLDDIDDDDAPLLVRLTPFMHFILGMEIADDGDTWRFVEVAVTVAVYGLAALFFWGLLEARVRKVAGLVKEQRAAREKRAEEAAAQRTSFAPPASPEAIAEAAAHAGVADAAAAAAVVAAAEGEGDLEPGAPGPEPVARDA